MSYFTLKLIASYIFEIHLHIAKFAIKWFLEHFLDNFLSNKAVVRDGSISTLKVLLFVSLPIWIAIASSTRYSKGLSDKLRAQTGCIPSPFIIYFSGQSLLSLGASAHLALAVMALVIRHGSRVKEQARLAALPVLQQKRVGLLPIWLVHGFLDC